MRNKVAIFGAGIAGLTAAHELIERGFEVSIGTETIQILYAGKP